MRKINQYGKSSAGRNIFHTATHFYVLKCMQNHLFRHFQQSTGTSCTHSIVNIKTSRQTNDDISVQKTIRMEFHAQISLVIHMLNFRCRHIRIFCSICFNLTGRIFYHFFPVRVITIYNSDVTHRKQTALAVQILIKICMLIWSNVIRRNIGKNTIIKMHSCHTVHLDSL